MCVTIAYLILMLTSEPGVAVHENLNSEQSVKIVKEIFQQEVKNAEIVVFEKEGSDAYLVTVFTDGCMYGHGAVEKQFWEDANGR